MTERVDLEAMYHVTEVAEFLGEPIKMSPAQLRTLLHEMTASRAVEQGMVAQLEEVRDLTTKVVAERDGLAETLSQALLDRDRARWDLGQIVDEFGDYEGLRQSREICDDRIAKLRNVRLMHKELLTEKYLPDRLNNAAFVAVVTMLGNVLDGAKVEVDPTYERLVELMTQCMHETWVFTDPAAHPDGARQVCGSCGQDRDKTLSGDDNLTAAITREEWLKKMGLEES